MPERPTDSPTGLALRIWLAASRAIPLLSGPILRRRLARGKEDHQRWREKLGEPSAPRPEGRLVWLHAVGLGEVLALRGLIAEMARLAPDVSFLVTSTARSSAQVIGANLPPRTVHQFLPLDAPVYLRRFLDHWRPDLSVWAEQELWPGAIVATHARSIPLAFVNARITAESFERRRRARALFADLLARFSLIVAQDAATAERLGRLGAGDVTTGGSLKLASPPLVADERELERLRAALGGRRVWVAASTHAGDEAEAMAAAKALHDRLLILVPRDIRRADAIAEALSGLGLSHCRRSKGELPSAETRVYLADSYGELGLWYRLADAALIGGGFDRIGGHNPWEAVALGVAVLHGPDTRNFAADYARLDGAGGARAVARGGLIDALRAPALAELASRAGALLDAEKGRIAPLACDLIALMETRG